MNENLLIARIKEDDALTFLILGSILDYIFGPKKNNFFAQYLFSAEVCLMPSAILFYICIVRA